jgi:hypothetical protein
LNEVCAGIGERQQRRRAIRGGTASIHGRWLASEGLVQEQAQSVYVRSRVSSTTVKDLGSYVITERGAFTAPARGPGNDTTQKACFVPGEHDIERSTVLGEDDGR